VGELQAQFLVDHLPTPGKGRIVRIYGAKTDNNAALFKRGQDRVLEPLIKSGNIRYCTKTGLRTGNPRTPSAS